MTTVGILGGGISGLATAYYLLRYGKSVVKKVYLIEGSKRVGSWIKSSKWEDGTVIENGPRSVRFAGKSGQNIIQMVEDLQLQSEIVAITRKHPSASKRMLLIDNQLHMVPSVSALFKKTPPFSRPLILSGMRDIFGRRKTCSDDSLYEFAGRRFGREIADYVVDPICRGIFAGDARKLSAKCLGKDLFEAEQKYGSVLLGLGRIKKKNVAVENEDRMESMGALVKRAKEEHWTMWNLRHGLQTLIDKLKEKLENDGVEIHLNSPITKLNMTDTNGQIVVKDSLKFECDHIISALPAHCLSLVLDKSISSLTTMLNTIETVSVGVVTLEFELSPQKLLPKQGFGFLVPSSEPVPILGIVFDSCIFPEHDAGRSDKTRLTVMLGGHAFRTWFGDPDKVSTDQLYHVAVDAVRKHLAIEHPVSRNHTRLHRNCIPQYTVGHYERLADLRQSIREHQLPLSLVGASYDGISVADCVYNAKQQVQLFLKN